MIIEMREEARAIRNGVKQGYADDDHLALYEQDTARLTGEEVTPSIEHGRLFGGRQTNWVKFAHEAARREFYELQGGRCAICKDHQSDMRRKMHLDHDHDDGSLRGLLCIHCNTLIGSAFDSIDILKNAIDYLRANGK
jgi:hypothetical protein